MAQAQSPNKAKTGSKKQGAGKDANLDIRINLLTRVAKQLQTVGVIALFLSLPLAVALFLPGRQPTAYPVEPQVSPASPSESEAGPSPQVVSAETWRCRFGGGEWRELPNSCADRCGAQNQVCAQVVTEGCDCGDGQCWDEEQCVVESVVPPEPEMVPDIFPPGE